MKMKLPMGMCDTIALQVVQQVNPRVKGAVVCLVVWMSHDNEASEVGFSGPVDPRVPPLSRFLKAKMAEYFGEADEEHEGFVGPGLDEN